MSTFYYLLIMPKWDVHKKVNSKNEKWTRLTSKKKVTPWPENLWKHWTPNPDSTLINWTTGDSGANIKCCIFLWTIFNQTIKVSPSKEQENSNLLVEFLVNKFMKSMFCKLHCWGQIYCQHSKAFRISSACFQLWTLDVSARAPSPPPTIAVSHTHLAIGS